jgi:two-component system, oxyanion-binding sensor
MTLTPLDIGFIPLTDAAPLIVAQEIGFAREEGLELRFHRAGSWAMLRDMLVMEQVAAAHMLAPMPVAMALGLGPDVAHVEALMVLSVNGDVVAVSSRLAQRMRAQGHDFGFVDAAAAGVALRKAAEGRLRFGVPFPFSTHAELVWHWLTAAGFVAPQDIEVYTVPPPLMARALAMGEIDAFCVGEPWGSMAVEEGVGELVLPGNAIWAFAPEKVLATRAGWAEAEPGLAGPLMRAVWRAGRWLARPDNSSTASDILARPEYVNVSAEIIERALTGRMVISPLGEARSVPGFIGFHSGAATFPWRSQSAMFAARIAGRQGMDPVSSAARAMAVFRTDLYRLHLREAGADLPGASSKLEGSLLHPTAVASERGQMILSADRFFDGRIFDPDAADR